MAALAGCLTERMRFEEVQEDARRRRERPTPVVDEIEMPREAEAPDGDRSQLLRAKLPLNAEPGEERDPESAFHGILDGDVAPEFERDVQLGERPTWPAQGPSPRHSGSRSPTRGR